MVMVISGRMLFYFFVNFTNIYFRFDLEHDKFGVDIQFLKEPVILREFVDLTEY